jgi:hypothetical protein
LTFSTSSASASPSRGADRELRSGGSQAHGTTGRRRTYVVQHPAAPGLNQHDSYHGGASLRLAVLWLGASCSLDTPAGTTTLSAFRARTAGRRVPSVYRPTCSACDRWRQGRKSQCGKHYGVRCASYVVVCMPPTDHISSCWIAATVSTSRLYGDAERRLEDIAAHGTQSNRKAELGRHGSG